MSLVGIIDKETQKIAPKFIPPAIVETLQDLQTQFSTLGNNETIAQINNDILQIKSNMETLTQQVLTLALSVYGESNNP